MNSGPVESLVFLGGLAVCASFIAFPVLGFTGIFSAIFFVYMGLALVNGAGTAEQRHKNRAAKKRRG